MEMSWAQILVLAFGNLAWMLPVFFWSRSEARADARQFAHETKEIRREMVGLMRELKEDSRVFREQWAAECTEFRERLAAESRDFHGRLCTIEERRR
jgi:hypothetical protein